jgi:F0F1-type ATP synthase assembly protein I
MLFQRKDKGVDPRERALWGDLMGLGMVFPIAIALGFFIGRWAGGLFGRPGLGIGVGLVWGVATGFWELYKTTVRLDRFDEARKKEAEEEDRRDG